MKNDYEVSEDGKRFTIYECWTKGGKYGFGATEEEALENANAGNDRRPLPEELKRRMVHHYFSTPDGVALT